MINTDQETRYWKNGEPAKFDDIKLGDKLRTKTHGVGKGKVRIAWEVFLDEASLLKFQAEHKEVHTARILPQRRTRLCRHLGRRSTRVDLVS